METKRKRLLTDIFTAGLRAVDLEAAIRAQVRRRGLCGWRDLSPGPGPRP